MLLNPASAHTNSADMHQAPAKASKASKRRARKAAALAPIASTANIAAAARTVEPAPARTFKPATESAAALPVMDLRIHLAMKRATVAATAPATEEQPKEAEKPKKRKAKKAPLPSFLPEYVEPEPISQPAAEAPLGVTRMSRAMLEDLGLLTSEPAADAESEAPSSPIGDALLQRKARFQSERPVRVLTIPLPTAKQAPIDTLDLLEAAIDATLEAAPEPECADDPDVEIVPEAEMAALEAEVATATASEPLTTASHDSWNYRHLLKLAAASRLFSRLLRGMIAGWKSLTSQLTAPRLGFTKKKMKRLADEWSAADPSAAI